MTGHIAQISGAVDRIIAWLRRVLDRPLWAVYATIFLVVYMVLFVASPAPNNRFFTEGNVNPALEAVLRKTADLTYNPLDDYPPETNQAKTSYRLLVPVLSRTLGLNMYGMYGMQVVAGVLVIAFSMLNAAKITGDRAVAFLVGVMTIGIHAGVMGIAELRGLFDSIPLALLMMALYFDRPYVVGPLVFLAAWSDERGLIASSLLFAFFVIRDERLFSGRTAALVIAWVAYFATRFAYGTAFGMETVGFEQALTKLIEQVNMYPMGYWSAYEGAWLIVLLAFFGLIRAWRRLYFILFAGALWVVMTVALSVSDISRSMAYALPGLLVALVLVKRTEPRDSLARLALVSAAVSLWWAPYYAHEISDIYLYYPLILDMLVALAT
jgi:hypothetical protein